MKHFIRQYWKWHVTASRTERLRGAADASTQSSSCTKHGTSEHRGTFSE